MNSREVQKCFYWTGVYDENSHVYECLRTNSTCSPYTCGFQSKNIFKRLKFNFDLLLLKWKINYSWNKKCTLLTKNKDIF